MTALDTTARLVELDTPTLAAFASAVGIDSSALFVAATPDSLIFTVSAADSTFSRITRRLADFTDAAEFVAVRSLLRRPLTPSSRDYRTLELDVCLADAFVSSAESAGLPVVGPAAHHFDLQA